MARITGPRARQELTELDKRHDASVLEGGPSSRNNPSVTRARAARLTIVQLLPRSASEN